jgi:ribosome biogenesis protein BMS1
MKEKHMSERKQWSKTRQNDRKAQPPVQNMGYKDVQPLICVVGPPRSGKSTLIRSLVKKYSGEKLDEIIGPITVGVNKTRKATFFEAPSDINSLIDVSKASDLVILTIDSYFGLEMETFETISLLNSHGFSKVICVLMNLDKITDIKRNKRTRRIIKKRIWKEVCPGIRMFYMEKFVNGRYLDKDVQNISYLIASMKYRPLLWKCMHPYVIVDRVSKTDESTVLCGYSRGSILKAGMDSHIPGVGDVKIESVQVMEDPCPIVDRGRKKLSSERKMIYTPMVNEREDLGINGGVYLDVLKEKSDEERVVYEKEGDLVLFSKRKMVFKDEEISEDDSEESKECETKEQVEEDGGTFEKSSDINDLEELKESVRTKFKRKAENEEDLIEKFNEEYKENVVKEGDIFKLMKDQIKDQDEKNMEELKRISGNKGQGMATPGDYVSIKVRLDEKFHKNHDPRKLLIVGGLLASEAGLTIMQGRIKKHKWFSKTMKSNDPLIISLGWRRFQTIPVFTMKDPTRNRFIKYTPDGIYCNISFYGPVTPPGSGFAVFREIRSDSKEFRISGSGVILNVMGKNDIVKKLKLIGYPRKIHQNTVFVKNMFSSDKEVSRFSGALLKTVSGLRGQIKKASGRAGDFRATFEGNILMGDIIFMKCYVPYEIQKIYISINNLLGEWKGIQLAVVSRKERCVQDHVDGDSEYRKIESRIINEETDFKLPKRLESKMPLGKRRVVEIDPCGIEIPVAPEEEEFVKKMDMVKERRKVLEGEAEKLLRESRVVKEEQEKLDKKRKDLGLKKSILEDKLKKQVTYRKKSRI